MQRKKRTLNSKRSILWEIDGDIGKYTKDLRQKIIRTIKVKAINEINNLNQQGEL